MPTDNTTFINPIGVCFILTMCVLIIILPRRYALVPVIMTTCLMTMGQRILVFGLNFTLLRILMLFGWIRVLLRREFVGIRIQNVDRSIIWWILSSIIVYTALWQTWDAFVNRLGLAYNAILLYFFFRFVVRDLEDIKRTIRLLAVFLAPLAFFMVVEQMTGRNLFAVFGAVREVTPVREGAIRSQGPFAHPILAGTFGATLLSLCVGLWPQKGRTRLLAALGIVSSSIITFSSASSGPAFTYLAGLLGLALWPLRNRMRLVRWGTVLALLGLQAVMKAPVWFLMARVDIFSGSTGWHRANLIDSAVKNFGEWWLMGTKSNADWGYGLFDVTNEYVWQGINGGLLTMILFIAIIVRCFSAAGRAVQAKANESLATSFLFWTLGASLFSHVVTYLSVPYFDQNIVNWYLLLAMICRGGILASRTPTGENTRASGLNPFRVHPVAAAPRMLDHKQSDWFRPSRNSQREQARCITPRQ